MVGVSSIKDHPQIIKSFVKRAEAQRWGNETELKIRRSDAGILKINFLQFSCSRIHKFNIYFISSKDTIIPF